MVFIGMNHPKHFWMFKEFINKLESKNKDYKIFVSSKDVLVQLLEESGMSYILLGYNKKGLIKKMSQLFIYTFKMIFYSLKYNPDLYIGQALPHFAYSSFFFRKSKFVILEDTEHVTMLHKFVVPFCQIIYTPMKFPNKFGKKQRFIDSIYELLYLHPNNFKPNINKLKKNGVTVDKPYAIIRIVSWNAHHDINKKGISLNFLKEIVRVVEKHGIQVYISTEKELSTEFEKYFLKIKAIDLHHILYYASIYIGEGATMAAEASVLGTYSIYINEMNTSFCEELSEDYNLMLNFRDQENVIKSLDSILQNNLKNKQKKQLDKFLSKKVDPLEYIMNDLSRYFNS